MSRIRRFQYNSVSSVSQKNLYHLQKCEWTGLDTKCLRVSVKFEVITGLKQGDVLSQILFNIVIGKDAVCKVINSD